MVGEPDLQAVRLGQLALRRGQRARGLHGLQAAHQQVVDGSRGGRLAEAEALAQRREGLRIARRAQVEVAAEDERVAAGQLDGCPRGSFRLERRSRRLEPIG